MDYSQTAFEPKKTVNIKYLCIYSYLSEMNGTYKIIKVSYTFQWKDFFQLMGSGNWKGEWKSSMVLQFFFQVEIPQNQAKTVGDNISWILHRFLHNSF